MTDLGSIGSSYLVGRFRELFEQGLSFNNIRHQLKVEGLSISSSLASDYYKQLANPIPLSIVYLPDNAIPNPEVFKFSSIPLGAEYRAVVSYSATDLITGDEYQGIFALDTDELVSIGEWKSRIAQTIEEDYYQGRMVRVNRVDFLNVYKRD